MNFQEIFFTKIYSSTFWITFSCALFVFGVSGLKLKADEIFDHEHLTENFQNVANANSRGWSVFADLDPKECWAITQIQFDLRWANRQGQLLEIGDSHGPYAFYSHSKGRASIGELSIFFDIPLKPTAVITFEISSRKFDMVHDGSWAWIAKKADDYLVLKALKNAAFADLKVDYFDERLGEFKIPLTGFSTANQLAVDACRGSTFAALSQTLLEL